MLRTICLIAISLILVTPLVAGVAVTLEVKEFTGGEPITREATIHISGGDLSMRMDDAGGSPQMIYRGDLAHLNIVDHRERRFMTLDEQTFTAMKHKMDATLEMMASRMEGMSPERRAEIEKIFTIRMPGQAKPGPEVVIEKTGEQKKVSGIDCQGYRALVEDERVREYWVADWASFEGGDELRKTMLAFGEFNVTLLESAGTALPFEDAFASNPFGEMMKLDGFPVQVRQFENDALTSETTLKSIEKKPIEPLEFEVPQDFEQQLVVPPDSK
jgi:hypothetical protein